MLEAGVDLFVIRGTVVSAEHVSQDHEPLNLKKFIYDLDVPVIVARRQLHRGPALDAYRRGRRARRLRRRRSIREPQHHRCSRSDATAIADVAKPPRYMDESGGRYVQVIADGGMGDSGSFIKAFALGADA